MSYDFWISAVKKGEGHIQAVKVHSTLMGKLGPGRIVPREFVADLINAGKATFCTTTFAKTGAHPKGAWFEGAHVHVMDEDFLTTDPNKKLKDNLGQLQEF